MQNKSFLFLKQMDDETSLLLMMDTFLLESAS